MDGVDHYKIWADTIKCSSRLYPQQSSSTVITRARDFPTRFPHLVIGSTRAGGWALNPVIRLVGLSSQIRAQVVSVFRRLFPPVHYCHQSQSSWSISLEARQDGYRPRRFLIGRVPANWNSNGYFCLRQILGDRSTPWSRRKHNIHSPSISNLLHYNTA